MDGVRGAQRGVGVQMTEVFNLQELREAATLVRSYPEPCERVPRQAVLALVEAVEAAQEMLTAYPGRDHLGRDARLRDTLARFSFNPKDSHE